MYKRQEKIAKPLRDRHQIIIEKDPAKAIRLAKSGIDTVIVSLVNDTFDGLRVCASLKFNEESRDIPILVIGDPEDETRFIRAYDIGINDTIMRPVEIQELKARVKTLLRRKFYADSLRENFNENLEMVVADPLTVSVIGGTLIGQSSHFSKSWKISLPHFLSWFSTSTTLSASMIF